ncbi:hypothetical protein [Nocardia sp. NBC_00511]|uniref:hypothetical protein n=1 Tax=Nocardia sp. NBC_00511 TaxID=2903591 RepID=UPI0030E0589E
MTLDILAFSLAAIVLALVVVMLAVGVADLSNRPTVTWCHRCSKSMIDSHHDAQPVCMRCRVRLAVDDVTAHHPG